MKVKIWLKFMCQQSITCLTKRISLLTCLRRFFIFLKILGETSRAARDQCKPLALAVRTLFLFFYSVTIYWNVTGYM